MIPFVPAKYINPVFKKDQPEDSFKFQPVPRPSGNYPYHLSLQAILITGSKIELVTCAMCKDDEDS